MIRVIVLYSNTDGGTFDFEYYRTKHVPMAVAKMTPFGLVKVEVDKGFASGAGGPPPFVAVAYMLFESLEAFQNAMETVGAEVAADVPNYTNIHAVSQISQVVE